LYYGFSIETILLLILFSIIIVLTFIDIDFQLLPNNLLIISLIPIILFIILQHPNNLIDHIVGGITMLAIFLIIGYLGKLVYKVDSMGMGDVKYAALIGIFLGWKLGLLSFVISFFSAALLIAAMSIIKKFNRKQRLAFGPFLSIGIFVSFFWGNEIINWYMGFYG
jgi:leader peptidase (prepilin peptidase)/N-methyltransferase